MLGSAVLSQVVLVGGGKMGEAIVSGLLTASCVRDASSHTTYIVVEPASSRRDDLRTTYGLTCVADVSEVECADIVILAVKPQIMGKVLADIAQKAPFARPIDKPLFVSIAAGVTTEAIETALGTGARVVRTMPNLPLQIKAGVTAVTGGKWTLSSDLALVQELFAVLGIARVVAESDIDAVCALSGSGPAYVAAMIEALIAAGSRQGLTPDLARDLALHTVYGTARLLVETNRDVSEFKAAVCSPGGTTLAALDAMVAQGFDQVFDAGVEAAVQRAKELAAS